VRRFALAFAIIVLALGSTACPQKKGPAEKAGEAIDETVDKLTHPNEGEIEKAGRKMGEAADDAKEAVTPEK
jgi:hypothetical protein